MQAPVDCNSLAVSLSSTIRETVDVIDSGHVGIALVLDEESRLLGTATDGDLRRGLLRNVPLDAPVTEVMNARPVHAPVGTPRDDMIALMEEKLIAQLPLVDEERRVREVVLLRDLLGSAAVRTNPVVIMAGGRGKRLSPLTDDRPKPLVRVGERPIMETLIARLADCGLSNLHVSVNYRAEDVIQYFGDGGDFGVNISYVREDKPLGTAGSLHLLRDLLTEPTVVVNGDVLTRVDFRQLLDYHRIEANQMTIAAVKYEVHVPYGVIRTDAGYPVGIEEKPKVSFFVYGGLSVLNPEVVGLIPRDELFDMPELITLLLDKKWRLGMFPVREYWIDVGQREDLERANHDFEQQFAGP